MPADELTPVRALAIAARLVNANVAHVDLPEAMRRTFMAQIAQALKEADRRAREDAATIAHAFILGLPVTERGHGHNYCAEMIEQAIRASITTDEG